MNTRLLCLPAMLLLAACERAPAPQTSEVTSHSAPVSGIELEYMNTSVRPGEDFFEYVNGSWLEQTEIPADKAIYSVFAILRDQAQDNVRVIIEQSAGGDFAAGSDEQKVGDLYTSYIDMDARNATGLKPLKAEWETIDSIADLDALAVYLASANRRGYGMPFTLSQYPDFKTPGRYMMYTYQGGLGLPDREYYLKEDDKSLDIRGKYQAHVEAMMKLAEVQDAAAAAQLVMDIETAMAEVHMPKEEARDMVRLYNKLTLAELEELMPGFNWKAYLSEAGIADIDGVVVTMLDHMRGLDSIFTETDLEDLKTYLKWSVLNATAGRLNEALDAQNFEFYGKVLAGREEQRPQWRRAVSTATKRTRGARAGTGSPAAARAA